MINIPEKLAPILQRLAALPAPGQEAYLVGGTVRDWLLGQGTGDMDLVVSGSAGEFAGKAASLLGGTAFVMDKDRDVHRVVIKADEHSPHPALPRVQGGTRAGDHLQLDVSPLKGSIEEDLAARDFTINAMAIKLHPHPADPSSALIDPFGGQADLQKKLIRALSREALAADPLRMMRAFRLAQYLKFEIEQETLAYIEEFSSLVSSVSVERTRDEIYLMLESPGSSESFGEMAAAGLLREVLRETAAMSGLPQGEAHRYDLLTHSLKTMEYAELVMDYPDKYFGDRAGEVGGYLAMPFDGTLTGRGLVKLCALLHDTGKPGTMITEKGRVKFTGHDEEGADINAGIAGRLKLSARASAALALVTRGHMRPLHMSWGTPTRHAVYRYVRDMGEDIPASLIVALADAMATRDDPEAVATEVEGLVKDIAEYYYGEYRRARAEPLIRGRDLVDEFGLAPGPIFREILDDVEEKRATGILKDRDEALEYIKVWLKT
jgi:poly(A) polymerase